MSLQFSLTNTSLQLSSRNTLLYYFYYVPSSRSPTHRCNSAPATHYCITVVMSPVLVRQHIAAIQLPQHTIVLLLLCPCSSHSLTHRCNSAPATHYCITSVMSPVLVRQHIAAIQLPQHPAVRARRVSAVPSQSGEHVSEGLWRHPGLLAQK